MRSPASGSSDALAGKRLDRGDRAGNEQLRAGSISPQMESVEIRRTSVRGERAVKEKRSELQEIHASIAAMSKRDFMSELGLLVERFSTDPGNPGSYGCNGCSRCSSCTFCKDCESCYACNYCVRCELCAHCSHCVDSKNCQGCAYCVQSEHCTQSAYLFLCRNLSDCNYCFGCVGLDRKDFHILNVAFERTAYFQIVERLKKQLGIEG